MTLQNETNRAGHMAVRWRILAGLEQLKVQNQGARRTILERRVPHLNHAPEGDVQADHVAGFFHGGEKIFSLPVARLERRYWLTVDVALNILPIAFEILAFQFFLKSPQCISHRLILLLTDF